MTDDNDELIVAEEPKSAPENRSTDGPLDEKQLLSQTVRGRTPIEEGHRPRFWPITQPIIAHMADTSGMDANMAGGGANPKKRPAPVDTEPKDQKE